MPLYLGGQRGELDRHFFPGDFGGAAESGSAIAMARKNRMDLTVSIALGSCIQIALFVAPMLVLASYFVAPSPLELSFSRACETVPCGL